MSLRRELELKMETEMGKGNEYRPGKSVKGNEIPNNIDKTAGKIRKVPPMLLSKYRGEFFGLFRGFCQKAFPKNLGEIFG